MTFLIDTHILLWYISGDKRVKKSTRKIIEDGTNKIYLSNASLWEIAIKISIGKLQLNGTLSDLHAYLESHNFDILSFDFEDLEQLQKLPFLHQDPFDRLIVAQALCKDIPVITNDANVQRYFE